MKSLQMLPQIILLMTVHLVPAQGATCVAPIAPYVPKDAKAAAHYREIIRLDFEEYLQDIQQYFRCLDVEWARAFEEAREVSTDYGAFLSIVGKNSR